MVPDPPQTHFYSTFPLAFCHQGSPVWGPGRPGSARVSPGQPAWAWREPSSVRLAPVLILPLPETPCCSTPRRWVDPEGEVVAVGHHAGSGLHGGHCNGCGRRPCRGRGGSGGGGRGPGRASAAVTAHSVLEVLALLQHGLVRAGLRLPAQVGVRANAGDRDRGLVQGPEQALVLRKAMAEAGVWPRGSGGRRHRGGVGGLVGHSRTRCEGRLRQLAPPAAWRDRTRGVHPRTGFRHTAAVLREKSRDTVF